MPEQRLSIRLTVAQIQQGKLSRGRGLERAGRDAASYLRGPSSLWPVDTGASKGAWRYSGHSAQSVSVICRLPYASYVERRTKAGRRSLLRWRKAVTPRPGRHGRAPAARTASRRVRARPDPDEQRQIRRVSRFLVREGRVRGRTL